MHGGVHVAEDVCVVGFCVLESGDMDGRICVGGRVRLHGALRTQAYTIFGVCGGGRGERENFCVNRSFRRWGNP